MDNFHILANQNPNNFIKNTKNDFAYIITIFGNDNYIIGAQCCSKALQSNKTRNYDIVIQITADVLYSNPLQDKNEEYTNTANYKLLKEYCDYIIPINYLLYDKPINKNTLINHPYFNKVFTKFQSLQFITYKKICLIDADHYPNPYFISKFNDIFININAPAACISSYASYYKKNKITGSITMNLYNDNIYSIKNINPLLILLFTYASTKIKGEDGFIGFGGYSASLMLLQPNINEYNKIIKDLETYNDKRLLYYYPEQNYLSTRYLFPNNIKVKDIKKYIDEFVDEYLPQLSKVKIGNNFSPYEFIEYILQNLKINNFESNDYKQILINMVKHYKKTEVNKYKSTLYTNNWTIIDKRYFNDMNFYIKNTERLEQWGFALPNPNKLWTEKGALDLNKSIGYKLWYREMINIVYNYYKKNKNIPIVNKMFIHLNHIYKLYIKTEKEKTMKKNLKYEKKIERQFITKKNITRSKLF